MVPSNSTSAILGAARRETENPGAVREAAEAMNGWQPSRAASLASKSEPTLPVRRHRRATGSNLDVSPSFSQRVKRFRPIALAPLGAMPPAPAAEMDGFRASPTGDDSSPKQSSGSRPYSLRPKLDRPTPAFAAPPRETRLMPDGDIFECAAPGFYERAVSVAPWSLAGSAARSSDRLSSSFLASGRPDMLPVAASDVAGQAGTMDSRSKLRRQREIAAMQIRMQSQAVSPSALSKARRTDPHADMSPAMLKIHDASFDRRLEKSTFVPATDRAIELLVQMSRRDPEGIPLSAHDFGAGPASALFPNAPSGNAPMAAAPQRTLSLAHQAFKYTAL